jgi:sulfate transport system ATP-binding protein
MSIEALGIGKTFGAFVALRDVSLHVPTGELVALLGPSGSGKTTLLRIIAGLEAPDAGAIRFHGEDTTDRHARERAVGFVFQHYALFRHMTVLENVAFGLRVKPRRERPGEREIRERVRELLALVQLEWLADRYPSQLSGGQRQRVALARALAVGPKVLLLDEPFGALDARVRKELRRWLRRLHDEVHITSVFVTHDQEEALEVADRVVVMNEGRIEQVGTPEEVHDRPATPFVCSFLGDVNLFHGRVHRGRARIGGNEIEVDDLAGADDAPCVAFGRTYEIDLAVTRQDDAALEAVVRHARLHGPVVRVELARPDGERIEAQIPRARWAELSLARGSRVYVRPRNLRVFLTPPAGVGAVG